MRLIWKKYDSKFDPVVTVVGMMLLIVGLYGLALLSSALRHPLLWVVGAIPLSFSVIGVVKLVREFQLWKTR